MLCWCSFLYTLQGQEALARAAPRLMPQLGKTFQCGVLLTLLASSAVLGWGCFRLYNFLEIHHRMQKVLRSHDALPRSFQHWLLITLMH